MRAYFLLFAVLSFFILTAQQDVIIEKYEAVDATATVNDLLSTPNNNTYVATDKGVYKILSNSGTATLVAPQSSTSLCMSKKGMWAAFANGDIKDLDNGTSFKLGVDGATVSDMAYVRSQLWVATNKGLLVFNAKSGKRLKHYKTSNSDMKSNVVNFVHVDSYENVWAGTEQGVAWIVDKEWKKIYDKGMNYLVIEENNEGKWMISDQEMFLVFEENRWQPLGLEKDLYAGTINDLAIDTKGKIYIASDVLVRLDPYNNKLETYASDLSLISKKCLALEIDNNNHVWIGTSGSGLYRIKFADNEAELLAATCTIDKELRCSSSEDASILVVATGGEKPYKYKWENKGLRGKNPKSLKPGKYTVTVTDKNKSSAIASVDIVAPKGIDIQIKELKRISKARQSDGKVVLDVSGGTTPYEYRWSNGEKSASAEKLPAGNHSLTITDASNCAEEAMVFIPQEKFIPELEISKINVGQTLRINELYFAADSSLVSENSYEVLDEIMAFLKDNSGVIIEIGGHTNGIPPHEYCDRLSTERAKNVASYLFDQGIGAKRVTYKGYGKREPIDTNESLAGRKKNQRVEMKIVSIDG